MTKILLILFITFLLGNCSTNSDSKFWSKTNEKKIEKQNEKILSSKTKSSLVEINKNIKIKLKESFDKTGFVKNKSNNFTIQNYSGNFTKKSRYKFSKIKNNGFLKSSVLFTDVGEIIYFDGNGSIYKLSQSFDFIWKVNYYTKKEKKLNPILNFAYSKDTLVVVDNLSYYYLINLNSGELIWKNKNNSPFNSHVKILENKIFVVDLNDKLKCYSLKNGNQLWEYSSEKTFIKSKKNLSIIVSTKQIIFINSLGDINSLDPNSGELLWQTPTQNTSIIEDSFSNIYSDLVKSNNSIFVSNNKNEMFSINVETGIVNWVQNIDSTVSPSVIEKLIFTFSNDGYFVVLDKEKGNVLRSTNIKKNIKKFEKKNLSIIGFIVAKDKIFLSLSSGKILKINIMDGIIEDVIKIDRNIISRPYVYNKKMFFITDGSLIKYN